MLCLSPLHAVQAQAQTIFFIQNLHMIWNCLPIVQTVGETRRSKKLSLKKFWQEIFSLATMLSVISTLENRETASLSCRPQLGKVAILSLVSSGLLSLLTLSSKSMYLWHIFFVSLPVNLKSKDFFLPSVNHFSTFFTRRVSPKLFLRQLK